MGRRADKWQAIRRLSDRLEPTVAREVLGAFQAIRGNLNVEAMARAITSGGRKAVEAMVAQSATQPLQLARTLRVLDTAFYAGGQTSARTLSAGLHFDDANPFAIRSAQFEGARLVRQVSQETKAAIRDVITSAVRDGVPPRESAKEIHDLVGLTRRQTRTVERVRTSALSAGASKARASAIAERAAAKLRKDRALNIARTETISATNRGQQQMWAQLQKAGGLAKNARKEWITTPDDRLCPWCEAMDGQTVPVGEPFISARYGRAMQPALHPRCRCAMGLAKSAAVTPVAQPLPMMAAPPPGLSGDALAKWFEEERERNRLRREAKKADPDWWAKEVERNKRRHEEAARKRREAKGLPSVVPGPRLVPPPPPPPVTPPAPLAVVKDLVSPERVLDAKGNDITDALRQLAALQDERYNAGVVALPFKHDIVPPGLPGAGQPLIDLSDILPRRITRGEIATKSYQYIDIDDTLKAVGRIGATRAQLEDILRSGVLDSVGGDVVNPIRILKYQGKQYIVDGHARLMAMRLRGIKTTLGTVTDADEGVAFIAKEIEEKLAKEAAEAALAAAGNARHQGRWSGLLPGHVEAGPHFREQLEALAGPPLTRSIDADIMARIRPQLDEMHSLRDRIEGGEYALANRFSELMTEVEREHPLAWLVDRQVTLRSRAKRREQFGDLISARVFRNTIEVLEQNIVQRLQDAGVNAVARRKALDLMATEKEAAFEFTYTSGIAKDSKAPFDEGLREFRRLTGETAMGDGSGRQLAAQGKQYQVYLDESGRSKSSYAVPTDIAHGQPGQPWATSMEKAADLDTHGTSGRIVIHKGYSSRQGKMDVVVHELAHHLEFADRRLWRRAKDFLLKRANGQPARNMGVHGGTGDRLMLIEDEWVKRGGENYTGRVYDDKSGFDFTEIVSQGVERLVRDPIGFARQDPDHFDFIVSILRPRGVQARTVAERFDLPIAAEPPAVLTPKGTLDAAKKPKKERTPEQIERERERSREWHRKKKAGLI